MKYHSFYILLAFVGITVAGCSTTNNSSVNQNSGPETAQIMKPMMSNGGSSDGFRSIELSASLEFPEGMTVQEYNTKIVPNFMRSPEFAKLYEFRRKASSAESWQEAHKAAVACIEQTRGSFFAFDVHQTIASSMLRIFFVTERPSQEVQQAVGYYMDVLLSYKNYNEINLKALVLPMLKGYWSDEKLSQTARLHFEHFVNPSKITLGSWLDGFFDYRAQEVAKQSPERYATTQAVAALSKELRQKYLMDKVMTFPKSQRVINPVTKTEVIEYSKTNHDNLAVLALLASKQSDIQK